MVSYFVDIMHDYSEYYSKMIVRSNKGLSKVISRRSFGLVIQYQLTSKCISRVVDILIF